MSALVEAPASSPVVGRAPGADQPLSSSSPAAPTPAAPAPAETTGVLRLQCTAQNYAWGRIAADSEVAGLVAAAGGAVDPEGRYAELWMGTHPSGPSRLPDGTPLRDWIAADPVAAMGDKVTTPRHQAAFCLQARPTYCIAQAGPAERVVESSGQCGDQPESRTG